MKLKNILFRLLYIFCAFSLSHLSWAGVICGEVLLSSSEKCSSLTAHFLLEECGEEKGQISAELECHEDTGWARHQSQNFLYVAKLKKFTGNSGRIFWDAPERVQQLPLTQGKLRKSLINKRTPSSASSLPRPIQTLMPKSLAATQSSVTQTPTPHYSSPSQAPPTSSPSPSSTPQAPISSPTPQSTPTSPQVSPSLLTGNPNFSLQIGGFTQILYTYTKTENSPAKENFDIALARLAFFGKILNQETHYFFQLQSSTFGNSNTLTLLDGWIKHEFHPSFSIIAGRFILPYSRQFYTHPGNLLFADLSSADYAFGMTRSLGAGITGKLERFTYYLNLVNSSPALDVGAQHGTGQALGTVGRIEFDVLDAYGYLESDPNEVTHPQLSIGLAAALNPIAQDTLFQNLISGQTTTNLTADFGFRMNRLSFQNALYYRYESGGPSFLSASSTGFYSQLGYFLISQRFELTARYSQVHFGKLNTPGSFQNSSEPSFGFNYYFLGHHLKLQADYTYVQKAFFDSSQVKSDQIRFQTQILF